MDKKIYLIPAIRVMSIVSESTMATSGLTSVTGEISDEVITEGYADSKKSVYDLWEDEDDFEEYHTAPYDLWNV